MEIEINRVIDILQRYVNFDLEYADPGWVRDLLIERCECTREEIEALGLDYIFPDDYWDTQEDL